jgi:hypothetical protein
VRAEHVLIPLALLNLGILLLDGLYNILSGLWALR